VTTFDNWSGVHTWADQDQGESLNQLVKDMVEAGFNDSLNSGVYMAGHQYCDSNYSGMSNGCDPQKFNSTNYNGWLSKVNNILLPEKFLWMLTEGNVTCNSFSNCATQGNGTLFTDFLKACLKQSQFTGFTVWMSNNASDFANANMGNGLDNKKDQFNSYSTVYTQNGNNYQFKSQFST